MEVLLMRLNQEDKQELREKVEIALMSVPPKQKIHLDKSVLEELLFDTIVTNQKTRETVKLPVWSGDFLRKLDLSEVSFDNVSWSLLVNTVSTVIPFGRRFFDSESYDKFCDSSVSEVLGAKGKVNYSHTNAKIDFSRSWEAKHDHFEICCCDFSGVDLSHNSMFGLEFVCYSDLSDTGIILTQDMFKGKSRVFAKTKLSNVDLSGFTVNVKDIVDEFQYLFDIDCDLSNSSIHITVDSKEDLSDSSGSKRLKTRFHDMLAFGYLNGCYINDKKVLSPEEQQALAEKTKSAYGDMKEDYISSVLQSIDEQKKGFGSK